MNQNSWIVVPCNCMALSVSNGCYLHICICIRKENSFVVLCIFTRYLCVSASLCGALGLDEFRQVLLLLNPECHGLQENPTELE